MSHEPSMEEILSSIKRIIAEDSEATLSVPRTKRAVTPADPLDAPEPVLELTETVSEPEPESVAAIQPEPAKPEPTKTEVAMEMSRKSSTAEASSTLASSSTVESSRSSLAALSALVVKPEITGTDTLEGMVREMLRPMVAEWLDARLPEIVDRMVQQEITRITRS